MKNLFKIGDKVKWGKRKGIFTVERLEEVDVVIVDQNRWEYPVSPSELTKVPKRAVKKESKVIRVPVDDTIEVGDEIDIPTNLWKGEPCCFDCFDSEFDGCANCKKENNWPNLYTLIFVVVMIIGLLAISY